MATTISKALFNAAVASAVAEIKPLLLNVEAAIGDRNWTQAANAAAVLHAALAEQLVLADALGSTGGMHTNSGGSGKGDAE